jgi:hypothetical protein
MKEVVPRDMKNLGELIIVGGHQAGLGLLARHGAVGLADWDLCVCVCLFVCLWVGVSGCGCVCFFCWWVGVSVPSGWRTGICVSCVCVGVVCVCDRLDIYIYVDV